MTAVLHCVDETWGIRNTGVSRQVVADAQVSTRGWRNAGRGDDLTTGLARHSWIELPGLGHEACKLQLPLYQRIVPSHVPRQLVESVKPQSNPATEAKQGPQTTSSRLNGYTA